MGREFLPGYGGLEFSPGYGWPQNSCLVPVVVLVERALRWGWPGDLARLQLARRSCQVTVVVLNEWPLAVLAALDTSKMKGGP